MFPLNQNTFIGRLKLHELVIQKHSHTHSLLLSCTKQKMQFEYFIGFYDTFLSVRFGSNNTYELVCSLRCANRHTIHFVYGINMPHSSCLWFSLSSGQTYVNNASLHCFQFMDVNKTAEFIIIFNEIHTMGR